MLEARSPTPEARSQSVDAPWSVQIFVTALVLASLITLIAQNTIFKVLNDRLFGIDGVFWWHLAVHTIIVACAVGNPAFRARLATFRSVIPAVLAYGAVVVWSTTVNHLPEIRVVESVLVPLTILSLAICLPAIITGRSYRLLFDALIAIVALMAAASLVIVLFGPQQFHSHVLVFPRARGARFAAIGLYTNQNMAGSYLECFPALIVRAMHTQALNGRFGTRRLLYATAFAFIVVALALTWSRSAQLVALISLLPVLAHLLSGRAARKWAAGAAGAAIIIIAARSFDPAFRHYLGQWTSLEGRVGLWKGFLALGMEHPLTGVGLLGVPINHNGPHNVYLGQFVYFGLFGFLLFICMLFQFSRLVMARLCGRADIASHTTMFLLMGVLLQGMVEFILGSRGFFVNSLFWILVGQAAVGTPDQRSRQP